MLDRTKIIKELAQRTGELSAVLRDECDYARLLWYKIAYDEQFYERACSRQSARLPLPLWRGLLGEQVSVQAASSYEALAIDGSQIYPDRHQGTSCYLINIGIVCLKYHPEGSTVTFDTVPSVALEGDKEIFEYTPEMVNAQRTERELQTGLEWMRKEPASGLRLFLFDGSLIFWYVQQPTSAAIEHQNNFFGRYLEVLEGFFESSSMLTGYISFPKSRDLVNILRVAAQEQGKPCDFAHINDSIIAGLYLEPGSRSIVFQSGAPVSEHYSEHSKPYFFYVNTGYEIARIEIPAWIALSSQRVLECSQVIFDQIAKGNGYPVALAEAHEQAVITHADRDFFYHLLQSMALSSNSLYASSQKSIKKRRMSV